MLLIVTAVLFLMSMPAHEASRFIHREEKNIMNKKHLLELLQGQVPQSSINQKTTASHTVSLLQHQVSPSAPNPTTYIPAPRISQRIVVSHNTAPPLLVTAEDSSAFPHAQWADFHPLARGPDSTIS